MTTNTDTDLSSLINDIEKCSLEDKNEVEKPSTVLVTIINTQYTQYTK